MADGVNIDWNAAPPAVDVVGNYMNAFKAGQAMGRADAIQNANAPFPQQPQGGEVAAPTPGATSAGQGYLVTPNPQSQPARAPAQTVQNAQGIGATSPQPGATGDVDALKVRLDGLPPVQRAAAVAAAQDQNEQLAHILLGLKVYPPEQRLAIAQHLAQQTGLMDPNRIGEGDVSDQGINSHLATTMSIEQMLKLREAQQYDTKAGAPQSGATNGSAQQVGQHMLQYYPNSGKVE